MDFEILSPTRKLKFCKLYLEFEIFVFYLFIILIIHNSFPRTCFVESVTGRMDPTLDFICKLITHYGERKFSLEKVLMWLKSELFFNVTDKTDEMHSK